MTEYYVFTYLFAYMLLVVGENGRWQADTSPLYVDNSRSPPTDVDFNLSRYMIQRNTDISRQNAAHSQWPTSRSADVNRNWRRADLVDDTPARERNTWELTPRGTSSPRAAFPPRLVTGNAFNGELAAVDSSDEEVWIPRLTQTSARRVKHSNCNGQESHDAFELKSSAARADVLRTSTKRDSTLCSTRS